MIFLPLSFQDVKVHVGFRSRPIHHRRRQFGEGAPFEMEKPVVPVEAEYPSHHPMRKFVVPDEEFLRPWSDASSATAASPNSLGEEDGGGDGEDYYYKDDTPTDDQPLGRIFYCQMSFRLV